MESLDSEAQRRHHPRRTRIAVPSAPEGEVMKVRTGPSPELRWTAFRSVTRVSVFAALVVFAAGAAVAEGDVEVVAICLTNTLDEPITYEYRWGTGSWSWDRLEAGSEIEHRLEVDPRGPIPQLQVRFRRSFGERGMRTVLRATPVKGELVCEPIFVTPSPEELAAQREEMLRSARDRWQAAASGVELELASDLDLYFDVSRRDREVVRIWKLGDVRPVVMGRISELRERARPLPVSLWGEGRYLVEIFDEVDLERVDGFVLDASDLPELTRLTPRLGPR
jgi:hypothetical protein